MKLRQIIENDEYAGLEDADEFEEENSTPCGTCGTPVVDESGDGEYCENCNTMWCANCASEQGLNDFDHNYPGTNVHTQCPNCVEYAGLEDADEFEENFDEQEIEAMNEMGHTPDSLGIPPELQIHGIELSSGAHAFWSDKLSGANYPIHFQWVHENNLE